MIIDESTDATTEKQLCVVVRYYSAKVQRIVSTFLGLILLESGTADAIFTALTKFLDDRQLPLNMCMGLATDGCNTMCGSVNSVITRFRAVNPNIVHIKCICYSIQLCSSHAGAATRLKN